MSITNTDMQSQIDELKAENARLRQQLAETRAQRAEYSQYLSELMPPIELPSEEEMIEQMKHLVRWEDVAREIREEREAGGANGS